MDKRRRKRKRGALLFETFVALMILSIGITGILRVFGQALFVGERNREKVVAKELVNHLLFLWFASPGASRVSERAAVTLPLDTKGDAPEYWYRVRSKALQLQSEVEDIPAEGEDIPAEVEDIAAFYQVELEILKERERNIYDLQVVIHQPKQVGS